MTVKPKKILIIGAGIGGLTTALACLQRGFEVQVLEQAPALEEVGAGIQIPPNASKILAALGLEQEIAARAFRPQELETRMGQSGQQVFFHRLKCQNPKPLGRCLLPYSSGRLCSGFKRRTAGPRQRRIGVECHLQPLSANR